MEELTHLVSLSVGTVGAEQHAEVFDGVTNYAKMLSVQCNYVNISSQLVGEDEEDDEEEVVACAYEHLHHSSITIDKVREALRVGLTANFDVTDPDCTLTNLITDLINEMQKAGILFREHSEG